MVSQNKTSRIKGGTIAALLLAFPLLLAAAPLASPSRALTLLTVGQTASGLVTSDPLTTGDTSLWTFGGSAAVYGAPYSWHEDAGGLQIGVQSNQAGSWAGYYAAKGEQAELFHATLSLPSSTIAAANNFNTGLYVQTGGTNVDYVTCAGGVNNQGYFWTVVEATGDSSGATSFKTLWFKWMAGQPLTRQCTIETDGNNLLKVYLDGTLVFSSDSMNLQYKHPLTVFLEVQSNDNTEMHFSNYQGYYATSSGTVTVTSMPAGSTAELVDTSGRVLASSQADTSGTASLDVSSLQMPIVANIEVLLLGQVMAGTASPAHVYGGDAYAVGALGGAIPPTGPLTTNPGVAGLINVNAGDGITAAAGVDNGSGIGGQTGVCLSGVCL